MTQPPPLENPNSAQSESANARPMLHALTSLRGLAALWVLTHNDWEVRNQIADPFLLRVIDKGYLAVDFFLVLSGFVLAYVYLANFKSLRLSSYVHFVAIRLARIYPLYITVLGLRVGLEIASLWIAGDSAAFKDQHSIGALIANVFMIQAWGVFDTPTWISSFWSISAEWFAYLLFPLAAVYLFRSRRPLLSSFIVQAGCIVLLGILSSPLVFGTLEFPIRYSLLRCLPEFLIGVALCLQFRHLVAATSNPASLAWVYNLLTLCVPLAALVAILLGLTDVVVLVLACVMIVVAPLASDFMRRVLELPLFVELGTISYAVYLIHLPVQNTSSSSLSAFFNGNLLVPFLIRLSIILIAATFLHYFVEKPSRDLLRRKIDLFSKWRSRPAVLSIEQPSSSLP